MPENVKFIFEHALPFMVAASQGPTKLNVTRIIEAVIIAGLVGLGTWFFLIPEMKTEFKYMKSDLHKIETKMQSIERDVNQLKIDSAVQKARNKKAD